MTGTLSPTRAATFKQCPLRYRFRAVDKLDEVRGPAAARGTLVHAVLERLFDLPAADRTVDAAVGSIGGEWAKLVAAEPDLAVAFDDERGAAAWFSEVDAMVRRWFTLEDPTVLEPAERELYVEVAIDGGLQLRGYVDRLDVAPGGELRVVDYKTGRAPKEMFERSAIFQMRFYALVLWRLRGVVPTVLQLVYLGDGQVVRYFPDEADLVATERGLRALWAAIERAAVSGDWRPSKSRLCDWCDFKGLCPAWGGVPPPLPPGASTLAVDPSVSGFVNRTEGD